MRRIWREYSLSIVTGVIFLVILAGQAVTGYNVSEEDRQDHGGERESFVEYLGSGHFWEATFENFESEFLQMGSFVWLTTFLRQKGSPESKKLDGEEDVDADPREEAKPNSPWPVHRGGLILKLYENSLTLALLLLFLLSFIGHVIAGAAEYSEEQMQHGSAPVSAIEYLGTSQLWFQSLQNWQSEYMSVFAIVVLSVFLRQRGSPESKPVAHPHFETGHA
ncbi:MAG: DUF6766 family protein [Candidatus Limnocylindria bacterium]